MLMEFHNILMGAKKSLELFDILTNAGFKIDYIVFDTGEGILPPKHLRMGYKKFKERMKKFDSPEAAFREELKQGKYVYEVVFKR